MSRLAILVAAVSFFAGVLTTWAFQSSSPKPSWTEVTVEELLADQSRYLGKTVAVTGYTYFYARESKTAWGESVQIDFYLLTPDKPRTGRGVILALLNETSDKPTLHSEKKSEIWARWAEIEVTGRRQYGLLYLAHVP